VRVGLRKEHIVAGPDFNRWWVPPASIAIHLCIGSVYAWSIFNPALTKVVGVVGSAADDWSLSDVVWVFSVAIVVLGLTAAVAGKWLEQVGPRLVGVVAAACWGGGFLVGGLGVLTHQLWLLYLGYGVIGGAGLGLGYVSPVSTLIRWFPDRRGMATGMAIMGFGGGAMIAAPMKEALIKAFYDAPDRLGAVGEVALVTEGGRRLARVGGALRDVVVVGPEDVSNLIVPGKPGVYLAGTGSVGAAETFFVLGVVYFLVMLVAAFSYRVPAPGWRPPGRTPPSQAAPGKALVTRRDVHVDTALRTPQFYLLWVVLCLNVTAGIGVLGVAKTMITEIFGSSLPGIVDGSFAATYVLMISVFNMVGRFLWASASDAIGRKRVFTIFFVLGIVLYLSIPVAAQQVAASPSVVWLVVFYAATMVIFTMYGGGFATIPAYLADIFGTRYVGAIHGRLLTAWSTAGVIGPLAITSLRERSVEDAARELVARIDPARFQSTFDAPPEELPALLAENTVTIQKLVALAPAGTPDPAPTLYNTTMILMAALLAVALIANARVAPVDPRFHLSDDEDDGSP
jgi:MFS family permease